MGATIIFLNDILVLIFTFPELVSLFSLHHSEWTETFPYDFRDERMMRHLRDITQKCIAVEPTHRKSVGQLMQALIKRVRVYSSLGKKAMWTRI